MLESDKITSVSVRLKRGVFVKFVSFKEGNFSSRLVIQARLEELSSIILVEIEKGCVFNWRTFTIDTKADTELEKNDSDVPNELKTSPLSSHILSVVIGSVLVHDGAVLEISGKIDPTLFHIYCPSQDEAFSQDLSIDQSQDGTVIGSLLWTFPSETFVDLWEHLHYEDQIKNELLSYVLSLIRLSTKGVNTKIVNVNRLLMLLGPPGTGKTSLCLALAQQLSICLLDKFPRSALIEINTHSLFSKWFSESGKLVMRMFDQIDEAAEDDKAYVFVLIDEIESLGINRNGAASRSDPADSIRAVNALLTQIDRIRRRPNVFIMCTSNLKQCLDSALIDRADLIRSVPPPGLQAVREIVVDCIGELKRIGLLKIEEEIDFSSRLSQLLPRLVGKSGRMLRKLPALVYADSFKETLSGDDFLKSLETVIQRQDDSNIIDPS